MIRKVILLNGPSSSGKSTLAEALGMYIKKETDEVYEVVSIDDFLHMAVNEVVYEDDVFASNPQLSERACQVLKDGIGVIIDHVITSERIFKGLMDALHAYPVCLVHVTCPIEILRKREAERKDRNLGTAESSYQHLYPKDGYDVVIDTKETSLNDCVTKIVERLQ